LTELDLSDNSSRLSGKIFARATVLDSQLANTQAEQVLLAKKPGSRYSSSHATEGAGFELQFVLWIMHRISPFEALPKDIKLRNDPHFFPGFRSYCIFPCIVSVLAFAANVVGQKEWVTFHSKG